MKDSIKENESFIRKIKKDKVLLNSYVAEVFSAEYEAVYMLDLRNDELMYVREKLFGKDMIGTIGSYRECMLDIADITDAEYSDILIRLSDPDFVQEYLKDLDRREFIIKLDDTQPWRRCLIKVLERVDGLVSTVIMGFIHIDEYEAKRHERELELAEAKLQAELASNAKSAFLFNMSHDIRTPMNAIIGFNNLALKNINNPEKLQEYLTKVEVSSKQLLTLINEVLDVSRIESGKTNLEEKPFSLCEKLDDIKLILEESAKAKKQSIRFDRDIAHDFVCGDSLKIERIIQNIAVNAIKYTPDGGQILCSIKEEPCEKEGCGLYVCRITDNGIGMSEELQQHIFEAFTRENSSTISGVEGTGLGMAITKSLVDMMGGEISIQSSLGEGTEVTVELVLKFAEDPDRCNEKQNAETDRTVLEGCRVLLVEDNEFNREIAQDILEELGVLVDTAEDGNIALDILAKTEPDYYDFVLMDIQMPIMDGYEATRQIRKMPTDISRVPIFAMTANAFAEDKKAAMDAGMDAHLTKPIDVEKLTETLVSFRTKRR